MKRPFLTGMKDGIPIALGYLSVSFGFGILAVALGSMVPSALRVFFASGKKRMPGGFALCLVVLTALATGMMESTTLEAMSSISMVMFFALAHIQATGKEMKNEK